MRLYIKAQSKLGVGYTPDWIKVSYKKNGKEYELTLDIHGEIEYDENGLNCRCKGSLDPWLLYNKENGTELNLFLIPRKKIEETLPLKEIANLLQNGTELILGVYPVDSSEAYLQKAKEDVLTDCEGIFELYDGETEYKFARELKVELND